MFITGQKVVCIDDTFAPLAKQLYTALPVKDQVYVVRGMAPGIALNCKDDELAVYLVGLHNPSSQKAPFREYGFKAERFRPLDELTTEEILGQTEPEEKELVYVEDPHATPAHNLHRQS